MVVVFAGGALISTFGSQQRSWVVCLHVLALQQFGNFSRVYPASCPITAEINSHDPHDWIRGKLDGIVFLSTAFGNNAV